MNPAQRPETHPEPFRWQRLAWTLSVMWLGLCIAMAVQPYCFEWDSAQYALGAQDFDIRQHQPHPPGYPLWVKLTGLLGAPWQDYLRPQRWLALAFTLAAILLVWRMALRWLGSATAPWVALLMAFSPVVMLYSAVPLTYAVDLFASALAGYTMLRVWEGRHWDFVIGCAGLGLVAGFRQSGVTFLVPMLVWMAVFALRRGGFPQVLAGVLAGAATAAVWYVPTALHTGGFRELAAINHGQMAAAASQMSIFYGASWHNHSEMLFGLMLYSGFAFGIPMATYALAKLTVRAREVPLPHWSFWFVWIAPNLLFNATVHNTKSGYLLLALPPLALLLSRGVPVPWLVTAIAASLLAAYLPYPSVLGIVSENPRLQRAAYHLMRSTPGVVHDTAAVQRALATALERHQGEIHDGYLLESFQEAPNLRALNYDFPSVRWHDGHYAFPGRKEPVWIVTAAYRIPPRWQQNCSEARKVWSNYRVSLWILPALEAGQPSP